LKFPNNNSAEELRNMLRARVIGLRTEEFERTALDVFRYQAYFNPVYKEYVSLLKVDPNRVERLTEIPFLPIQFFKNHLIRTGQPPIPTVIFESSGTTGNQTSRHHLFDAPLYQTASSRIFTDAYGPLNGYHLLALLPSYLERNNSSLVYMIEHFIAQTASEHAGFYLHNVNEMVDKLRELSINPDGKKVLLMGVTFALLDLAESDTDLSFLDNLPDFAVMDTGGMKGRRRELLREEVHQILAGRFRASQIHSEYGMTELLSQSYSKGEGLFHPGATMRILLREINDPFAISDHHQDHLKTGGINVVDLANIDSCAFIETQDLGRFGAEPNSFYVMGRFDNSDVRGCNLMAL
jgi:hypothetical protein